MKSDDRSEALGYVVELAAMPGAEHCAQSCAWVPGSGLCSRRDCPSECLFRPWRGAEAERLRRHRQRRRAARRPFARRVPEIARDAARRPLAPLPDPA